MQDPLLLSIFGTAIILAVLVVGIALFWRDGPALIKIPWLIPLVSTFSSLAGICVAFLSLGRYQVLRDPISFWIGIAFASLCIGQVFYVLAWPGLLPNGHSIIARLPNTSAFLADFTLTILGCFLLAAALVLWPGGQVLVVRRWLRAVALWILSVTLVYVLIVSFEQYLPVLVRPDGTFTQLLRGWAGLLLMLFVAGAYFSTRYYQRSGDSLAGYLAFSQMALVFVVLMTVVGGKRYDLWWYTQRVVLVLGYLILLFGLLSDYLRLLRRENEGRQLLDAIMQNIPIGLVVTSGGPDFRVMAVSRHGFLMNQRSPDELVGIPAGEHQAAWKIYLPDGVSLPAPEDMPLYRASRLGVYVRNMEFVMEALDGRKIPVLVNAAPVFGTHGEIVAAINTWLDITEIKQADRALRESEQRYSALFNARTSGIAHIRVLTDDAGKPLDFIILEVNEAFEQIMGVQNAAIEGQKATEVFPGIEHDPHDFIGKYARVAFEGGDLTFEAYVDDTQRWFSIYVYRPKVAEVIAIFTDISERKRAEEALTDAAKKLEQSNRELEQFAFVASHDLQEPLRKIEAFGEGLLLRSMHLDESERDYLERMRKAAGRMRDMVDGLLELSRLNTRTQPFAPVSLARVTAEVLSDLDHQIERSGGRVEVGWLPTVEGDPQQLHRLMQNLIGNALKFYRPNTPPLVLISATQLDGSVEIKVEDNGIGFNPEDTARIFQPFQRLVGRSEYEGSGMGLSICRRIVERHGGDITAQSEKGKGAVFIVTLPVSEALPQDR